MKRVNGPEQLIIPFDFQPEYRFDNFIRCLGNEAAYQIMNSVMDPGGSGAVVFLVGEAGTGKTHLCQALIQELRSRDSSAVCLYHSFRDQPCPSFSDQIEKAGLLILEDMDRVSVDDHTDETVFSLFNTFYHAQKKIILTSRLEPSAHVHLHDRLTSRFASGMVVQVGLLDESTCMDIIRKRARDRQVNFPDKVINYIITRVPRNPDYLHALFDAIDTRSLQLKKPISIKLVRQLLGP
ncbi:ATP-binding protein [bacterium]|nr:ATP-binding protein [bacterium]